MFNFLLTHTPLLYLTQSFWRDEAYSVLIAEKPIATLIGSMDFEPPLYYMLLHFWMKLFGNSEIATRSLSLLGFSLATIVVIFWAEKMFKKHWLSWFVPILFFFNPMLLYYAFEVRAYGWVMFFSTLALYAYSQKKYPLLIVASVLSFYTHTYTIFLPVVFTLHWLFVRIREKHRITLPSLLKEKMVQSIFLTGLAILPWFIPLYDQFKKNRPMWYFPVDLQLVKSVLGNMFVGYDGTPGNLWPITALLSLGLIGLFYLAMKKKIDWQEKSFLLFTILIPLGIIISLSFIKPLFVNRYLIYVTIAEILLIGYAIEGIKSKSTQKIVGILILFFSLATNCFLPSYKAKVDIRSIVVEANIMRKPTDVIYVTSPLIYFETVYYTKDRNQVFLYNPDHNPFPWYVGQAAFNPSQMAYETPAYPKRAIIIGEDRSITVAYQALVSVPRQLPPAPHPIR